MTSSINGCVYSYQTTMRKILFWGLTKQSPCLSQVVRRVLGLFLIEPHQMIKIAALTFLGCKRKIHWFGLNPQTLTAEQASAVPLLLIHGRMHNQGIWISLAKAVREENLSNPIYTLNLSRCGSEKTDIQRIYKKIEEIQEIYKKEGVCNCTVDLLGYSLGGYLAYKAIAGGLLFDGGLISLGCCPSEIFNFRGKSVHEIQAVNEFLCVRKSRLPSKSRTEISTTHLGLPFSIDFHKRVIELMAPRTQLAAKALKKFNLCAFSSSNGV